jgi:hypothetical protein
MLTVICLTVTASAIFFAWCFVSDFPAYRAEKQRERRAAMLGAMKVIELKAIAKSRRLTGYSRKRKAELVVMLAA